jgi:hypothetical protein
MKMILRADHIAGGAFVLLGAFVLAISGDLPFGQLSMPGSGFLPRIVAIALIVLGLALMLRAGETEPLSSINWSDAKHASMVIVIAGLAIAFYTILGFLTTMFLMMGALLIIIERRHPLRAGIYCLAMVLGTYVVFSTLLKTPMPTGPFGF